MNYVGELGWELHHPIEYQNHVFDALMEAGADLGLAPFGIRAMDSMRFEKSYRMVGTELSIEYAALESDLGRFVHLNKGDFIGRDALQRWMERGFSNRLVTLEVHDVADADALGNNPLFVDGELVGRATGGNYGFRVGQVAGAGDGEAGARRSRHHRGDGHPGDDVSRDGDSGVAIRSGEREVAGLNLRGFGFRRRVDVGFIHPSPRGGRGDRGDDVGIRGTVIKLSPARATACGSRSIWTLPVVAVWRRVDSPLVLLPPESS